MMPWRGFARFHVQVERVEGKDRLLRIYSAWYHRRDKQWTVTMSCAWEKALRNVSAPGGGSFHCLSKEQVRQFKKDPNAAISAYYAKLFDSMATMSERRKALVAQGARQ